MFFDLSFNDHDQESQSANFCHTNGNSTAHEATYAYLEKSDWTLVFADKFAEKMSSMP